MSHTPAHIRRGTPAGRRTDLGYPGCNFWYAEHDPAHAVGRYPWTATLQMDGMALSSDYWFETQAACEEFIRDELIGTVGHYEMLEVRG